MNNPIFGLVREDGVTPLPKAVWEQVGMVTTAVFNTIESLSPPEWTFILTSYLDGITDQGFFRRAEEVAAARDEVFVPVRLLCEPAENARRIVAPQRRQQHKSIDAAEPERLASIGPPWDPGHPNTLSLDITDVDPAAAAAAIAAHAAQLPNRSDS